MILPGGTKRIQGTFEDENGSLYDPDSIDIIVYDADGTVDTISYDESDCVRLSVGVWYLDYPVASLGVVGRWTAVWTNTVSTKTFTMTYNFIVQGTFWPNEQEVREHLAGLNDDRVSEETIEQQIVAAVVEVNLLAVATTPQPILTRTYVMVAAWMTYKAYATEFERTAGIVPGPVINHLNELKADAERWIEYCKRGAGPKRISGVISTGITIVPQAWDQSKSKHFE